MLYNLRGLWSKPLICQQVEGSILLWRSNPEMQIERNYYTLRGTNPYPTLGKGKTIKASSKVPLRGDMLVPKRVTSFFFVWNLPQAWGSLIKFTLVCPFHFWNCPMAHPWSHLALLVICHAIGRTAKNIKSPRDVYLGMCIIVWFIAECGQGNFDWKPHIYSIYVLIISYYT